MAFTKKKAQYVNVTEGRNNVKIAEVIKKYPDGIHITGCTIIKGKKGECSAWIFDEDATVFFFGGKVFTDTLNDWIAEKGSIQNVNTEMSVDKPLIKITECKSKSTGETYYDFEI